MFTNKEIKWNKVLLFFVYIYKIYLVHYIKQNCSVGDKFALPTARPDVLLVLTSLGFLLFLPLLVLLGLCPLDGEGHPVLVVVVPEDLPGVSDEAGHHDLALPPLGPVNLSLIKEIDGSYRSYR